MIRLINVFHQEHDPIPMLVHLIFHGQVAFSPFIEMLEHVFVGWLS